jgi:hypothetical protein
MTSPAQAQRGSDVLPQELDVEKERMAIRTSGNSEKSKPQEQVMEILLGVAVKTISIYLDHISPIDLDPAFRGKRLA